MDSQNRPQAPSSQAESRRSFFGVSLGLASAFVAFLLGVPVLRYLFYPLSASSGSAGWSAAGSFSKDSAALLPLSCTLDLKQQDGWRETNSRPGVYLIRKGDTVQALSAICPHLGCSLPWDASRREFVCPCHGGTFGPDGSYRSGPPRRSMDTLETKVTKGTVMVRYRTFRPDVPNKQVTS
jgi:Rieske Fe-S protein